MCPSLFLDPDTDLEVTSKWPVSHLRRKKPPRDSRLTFLWQKSTARYRTLQLTQWMAFQ